MLFDFFFSSQIILIHSKPNELSSINLFFPVCSWQTAINASTSRTDKYENEEIMFQTLTYMFGSPRWYENRWTVQKKLIIFQQ